MIINSTDLESDTIIETDICVAGAGVAGICFAREFNNSDIDIVILESGSKEPDDELSDLLNSAINVGLPYSKLNDRRARAIGGSSHSWSITLPDNSEGPRLRSLDKIDFEKRDWVPYSGWPITKADLDPYYKKAHALFEIGPYRYDAEYWLNKQDHIKLPLDDEVVLTTVFHFARRESFTGKRINELEKSENIKVYINATAVNIHVNEEANQAGYIIASDLNGKRFKVKARYFILAMGAVETPRLLLLSDGIMKNGVGNQNDLVGRFFMEHPHIKSGIFYPSGRKIIDRMDFYNMHMRDGVPIMGKLALTEGSIRREKLLNFSAQLRSTPARELGKADKSFRHLAKAIKRLKIPDNMGHHVGTLFRNLDLMHYVLLRNTLNGGKDRWYNEKYEYHGFEVIVMSEQTPDPESKLTLDHSRDRFGQKEIKLNWKLNSQDIRSIIRSQKIIDRELRNSKLGKLNIELKDNSIPDDLTGGWHHMGTTRMSVDPKQGVVDKNCCIHGIANLYVAGPSVFPTCGYANPVLTIAALSIRLADHLKGLF